MMSWIALVWVVLFTIASFATEPSAAAEKVPVDQTQQRQTFEKAFISFRIGVPQWMPENRFRELLALFEKYKGATDEITFFTSATHPPLPLDEIRRRTEILTKRIVEARSRGYRAGINVLATMGHHNENLPHSLGGDYTRVTDIHGGVCQGSFCPNDPRFQEYVRDLYRVVAQAGPDYIWIDDDVRLAGHMPVDITCFCDHCLAVFEKESGVKYTRATLRAALTEGPMEKRLALRKAWLAHNRATIQRLLTMIERTVHEVKPGLPLGFMTGDRFFEGYDFDRWAEALAGPDRAAVFWRPGGGFYEDSWIPGLVGKSHDIGRQVSLLPTWVLSIQSEIENFPYQRLKKAVHITVVEAASHMAAGCTGAAFNVLSANDEPLDEFEPLVARIHQTRLFYDLMAKHLGRTQPVGAWPAWNKDLAAAADLLGGDWFARGNLAILYQWPQVFEIGIPAAYSPQGAAVTFLFQQSAAVLSKEEITKILASGVYMDAETLDMLNRMGFQELTGLAVERSLSADGIEELTAHPLNGPFAGRQRDCRQSFNHQTAYGLKKVDPKAETLAHLVNYAGEEMAPISMAVFENRLGGRVCVGAYFPWSLQHNLSKSAQMKSVMRWLSRDQLPGYVSSYHKVNLWIRQPTQNSLAIALVNASFDPAEGLELTLRTQSKEVRVFDMTGGEQRVRASGSDGPYTRFVLPCVEPWSVRLVVSP